MFGSKDKNEVAVADTAVEDAEDVAPDKARRGGIVGLITLPFRIVGALFALLLLPLRLAWAVVSRIVRLAADIVYAIWRFFAGIVAAIMAVVRFVFRVFDRTVGALVRFVLRLIRGIITLPLRAFKIGTKVGVAEATVKTAAATAGATASAKLAEVKAAPGKVSTSRLGRKGHKSA